MDWEPHGLRGKNTREITEKVLDYLRENNVRLLTLGCEYQSHYIKKQFINPDNNEFSKNVIEFVVYENPDDWWTLYIQYKTPNSFSGFNIREILYKCDQFDGLIKCIMDNVNEKSIDKYEKKIRNIKESHQELCQLITSDEFHENSWKSERYTEFEKNEIIKFLKKNYVKTYHFFAFDVSLRILKSDENIDKDKYRPGTIKNNEYLIQKKDDDWFYVRHDIVLSNKDNRLIDDSKFWKIDGWDGLIQYLEMNISCLYNLS
jgi:hypothetical protein